MRKLIGLSPNQYVVYLHSVIEHQDKLIEELEDEKQRLMIIKLAYEEKMQNDFIHNRDKDDD